MRNKQFFKFAKSQMVLICLILVASLFMLGGCGGGSDSGTTPTTENAIEAWSGNWSGSGKLSGSVEQEGGTPMLVEIPMNFTSVLVEKGSGVGDEAMTILLNGTANTQVALAGQTFNVVITLKDTKATVFGQENEDGSLNVTKGSLAISAETVEVTVNGEVMTVETPGTYELPLTDPLLLTSKGFSYTFDGTKDDVSGNGKLEGTLSGNSATITGSGSGSGDVSDVSGSLSDLKLELNLTKK